MKVSLIVPPYNLKGYRVAENLGVRYLAAYLEGNGYIVNLIDAPIQKVDNTSIIKSVLSDEISFVGISVPFLDGLQGALDIAQKLKTIKSTIHISLGGHVPSFEWEKILQIGNCIDSIVIGEGEISILELLRNLEFPHLWNTVRGIAYNQNGKVFVTEKRGLVENISRLPYPKRSDIIDRDSVHYTMVSSRGCPYNCTFCSVAAFYTLSKGQCWRYRTAENVVDEVEYLVTSGGALAITFVDDNFLGSSPRGFQRAEEIAELIISRNIKVFWSIESRATDFSFDLFTLMRKAGLRHVFVGAESGSEEALGVFNKGLEPKDTSYFVNQLRNLDIDVDCHYIPFHPYITFPELKNTIVQMGEVGAATYNNITNQLHVYKGTPVYNSLLSQDRLKNDGWDYTYKYDRKLEQLREIYLFGFESFKDAEEFLVANGKSRIDAKEIISEKICQSALQILSVISDRSSSLSREEKEHYIKTLRNESSTWLSEFATKVEPQ